MLGKTLNKRYEVIKSLGKGGFGETYIAQDKFKPVNSLCVIKQLKPKRTDPDTLKAARELFEREAKVLYQLGNHDQIPRLLAHFEEEQEFYLAQEFIDGDDLKKELELVKQLNEEQVIDLLQDVIEILKFVHQQQVIHRDIKPSNLIRRRQDGKFALIDFGAVKQVSIETSPDGLTSFTIAVGTRGYMPNEQLGGKPRFSSDIYALGMTAIHALTGMSPPTPSKKIPKQLQEDSRTGEIIWRQYAPQVSDRLAAILDKMVKSHYRDRYEQVDDVLKDLQKLYSTETTTSTDFSTITTRKLPSLRLPKAKYILVSLAAIGVAIGAGITIPQLFSSRIITPNPPPPSTGTNFLEQGNELYNAGKYEEAVLAYDKALKSNPDNPAEIWKSRGSALTELQKYEEAIASYDKALKIKPDDVDALNSKGVLLRKLNKYEEAIATYEKILKIDPKNSKAWNNRGTVLAFMGKYEEAIKDIDKSLEINPEDSSTWNNRGEILQYGLERYKEAVAAYDKATNIEPNSPQVWFNRGKALFNLKQYSDAIYSYDEAIRNKQDYFEAWFEKGKALYELKQYKEAVAAYDKAIELKPDYQEAKDARKQATDKL